MSLDGYIDDATPQRLLLSNEADFDRVDSVRAGCDAIMIGATTLRRDNPRLLVNSPTRRAAREARGLPAYPLKVAVTASGDLDPNLRFWHSGGAKVVYCPDDQVTTLRHRLAGLADIVGLGAAVDLYEMLDDLVGRGIGRLMVEGGTSIHTQFLTAGIFDELHLAVAPFFVGDPSAPRFVGPGAFLNDPAHRLELAEVQAVGDVALLRYVPAGKGGQTSGVLERDRLWLQRAVELSRRCPASRTAFSVGAVIVDAENHVMAEGYSRDTEATVHAEESALNRVAPGDPRLASATIYTSMEPCSERRSRPRPCTELIASVGIRRVVFALREPAVFVAGRGVDTLRRAGITVVELPELADAVRDVNVHLLA